MNQQKPNIIASIIGACAIFAVLYLIIAFIRNQIDIRLWSDFDRAALAGVFIYIAFYKKPPNNLNAG